MTSVVLQLQDCMVNQETNQMQGKKLRETSQATVGEESAEGEK